MTLFFCKVAVREHHAIGSKHVVRLGCDGDIGWVPTGTFHLQHAKIDWITDNWCSFIQPNPAVRSNKGSCGIVLRRKGFWKSMRQFLIRSCVLDQTNAQPKQNNLSSVRGVASSNNLWLNNHVVSPCSSLVPSSPNAVCRLNSVQVTLLIGLVHNTFWTQLRNNISAIGRACVDRTGIVPPALVQRHQREVAAMQRHGLVFLNSTTGFWSLSSMATVSITSLEHPVLVAASDDSSMTAFEGRAKLLRQGWEVCEFAINCSVSRKRMMKFQCREYYRVLIMHFEMVSNLAAEQCFSHSQKHGYYDVISAVCAATPFEPCIVLGSAHFLYLYCCDGCSSGKPSSTWSFFDLWPLHVPRRLSMCHSLRRLNSTRNSTISLQVP